jgi:hypothetical protein
VVTWIAINLGCPKMANLAYVEGDVPDLDLDHFVHAHILPPLKGTLSLASESEPPPLVGTLTGMLIWSGTSVIRLTRLSAR